MASSPVLLTNADFDRAALQRGVDRFDRVVAAMNRLHAVSNPRPVLHDCEACLAPSVPVRYESEVGGFVCRDGCPEG